MKKNYKETIRKLRQRNQALVKKNAQMRDIVEALKGDRELLDHAYLAAVFTGESYVDCLEQVVRVDEERKAFLKEHALESSDE